MNIISLVVTTNELNGESGAAGNDTQTAPLNTAASNSDPNSNQSAAKSPDDSSKEKWDYSIG